MAILVTGGAGYIGSHTVKRLIRDCHDVVVLDDLSEGHRQAVPGAIFVHGDIGDTAILNDVFRSYPITAVLHFAAKAYVGESVVNPASYYSTNVAKGLSLLEAMRAHGVGRIIFSSTCATYGEPEAVPIVETHPQRPINPYGFSKMAFERILDDYDVAYGLKSIRLRYFNAAGSDPEGELGEDHLPETHLIPLVLQVAQGGRKAIQVFGTDYPTPDGTCIRDYIHVTDLAEAHVLALQHLLATGTTDVFNLGAGNGYSVLQIIQTARRVTGHPIPVEVAPRRVGDPAELVGGSDKARSVLGWTPRHSELDSIISTAWRWFHTHPGGYEEQDS